MSAAQLSMFEPDSAEAVRLLLSYMREAQHHEDTAERFALLQMPGAAARAHRLRQVAEESALVLAIYLDLEQQAGTA
jgi:hypothetical protein